MGTLRPPHQSAAASGDHVLEAVQLVSQLQQALNQRPAASLGHSSQAAAILSTVQSLLRSFSVETLSTSGICHWGEPSDSLQPYCSMHLPMSMAQSCTDRAHEMTTATCYRLHDDASMALLSAAGKCRLRVLIMSSSLS